MTPETLQDRAAHYLTGDMTLEERESFEVVLSYHEELRRHVIPLQETTALLLVEASLNHPRPPPPPSLRTRLLTSLAQHPTPLPPPGLVVTDAKGFIEWVNPAFTAMCGHELADLKGRKPGPLLQGPETDPTAITRLRTALHNRRTCGETLVNYHKNGTPYRVQIHITPLLDDQNIPLWFVAKEHKLPSP